MAPEHEPAQWSSRRAFLLAAIGSAVGLGNIWRFPYITGVSGGGAFVLVYCLCIAIIGVPLLMAEIAIGRRGGRSPVGSMRKLSDEEGASHFWTSIGWQAVLAPTVGLMYYSVVAGWTLDYALAALMGAFEGISDADGAGAVFAELTGSPGRMMISHAFFILLTVFIVAAGVKNGLERATKYLMPVLLVILLVLVGYTALTADFVGGLRFLFTPDFGKLTPTIVLMAIGQAFFSVNVAVGAFITYGAYVPKHISIPRVAVVIAIADTAVALLVGLVIFPLVFSYGLEPGEGPGLVFVTLPIAFGQMPAGAFFGALFFALMAIADFGDRNARAPGFVVGGAHQYTAGTGRTRGRRLYLDMRAPRASFLQPAGRFQTDRGTEHFRAVRFLHRELGHPAWGGSSSRSSPAGCCLRIRCATNWVWKTPGGLSACASSSGTWRRSRSRSCSRWLCEHGNVLV